MKRRDFLRYGGEVAGVTVGGVGIVSLLSEETTPPVIHPPGARIESEYLSNCIKCGRCIQSCPVDALGFADFRDGILRSGSPKLVPDQAGCIAWEDSCLACIDACPTDSLEPIPTDSTGIPTEEIIGRAQIDADRCINCANCYPICPVDAVIPHHEEHDRPTFSVDIDECVGCGRCVEICPVDGKAVKLYPPEERPSYPIDMADRGATS